MPLAPNGSVTIVTRDPDFSALMGLASARRGHPDDFGVTIVAQRNRTPTTS
jgi:hypothetical protein